MVIALELEGVLPEAGPGEASRLPNYLYRDDAKANYDVRRSASVTTTI